MKISVEPAAANSEDPAGAAPVAPLYPQLVPTGTPVRDDSVQVFRLQKIGELEAFLRAEIERRSRLHKKYCRAVNALDGTCATLGIACVTTGAVGAGLLASGIGFVPGLVLEAVTGAAGLLDVVAIAVSRRCSAKARKHDAVRILASAKLNTVHSHVSKALEDCKITDEEYKLVLEENVKYSAMKEEIRRKHAPAANGVIGEATKNELIKLGREQARASFIKKLGASESLSP